MEIKINKESFWVHSNEFQMEKVPAEICNLRIRKDLGIYERLVSFIYDKLYQSYNQQENENFHIVFDNPTHGGYLPFKLIEKSIENNDKLYENIHIRNVDDVHFVNISNKLLHIYSENEMKTKYKKESQSYKYNGFISDNYDKNIQDSNEQNVYFIISDKVENALKVVQQFQNVQKEKFLFLITTENEVELITEFPLENCYQLSETKYWLCFYEQPYESNITPLMNELQTYITIDYSNLDCPKKQITYDNLLELCMIVKNAGPQFEETLRHNLPLFDHWTIFDTGSTDNTKEIIHRISSELHVPGRLHEENISMEKFHFGNARNKSLDLAGTFCKFIVTLDDTYRIDKNIRNFMKQIRGDQYADSYSIFIKSNDMQYNSNRIIKSESNLRYMYRIHEVITDKKNVNIMVPEQYAIMDHRFDYMETRTMNRKKHDIDWLFEEVMNDPFEPRNYYYLGQTYNLLQDYEKAFFYFMKRADFSNSGFIQERYDALFEATRIANFQLHKPWNECFELYTQVSNIDSTRPESYYFIGIHYLTIENDKQKAFTYLKKAFECGVPIKAQYSLRPTLYHYFIPYYLTTICYECNEYALGQKTAEYFLTNYMQYNMNTSESNKINNHELGSFLNTTNAQLIESWYNIFKKINENAHISLSKNPIVIHKPIMVFVADGGFKEWCGSTILKEGVGGSETYIIEMARNIQKQGKYEVYVFCKSPVEMEIFEGVHYLPLLKYGEFIKTHYVSICIISRFSEYIPLSIQGWTENIYVVLHDLLPSGCIIPKHEKLKQIYCLTEWHVSYFTNAFPMLKDITTHFYYGIDQSLFHIHDNNNNNMIEGIQENQKKPYSFIYSSFPNRGLLPLLQMWKSIYAIQPLSTLQIFCNLDGEWVNQFYSEQIKQIKNILNAFKKEDPTHCYGITLHNWVSKSTLANAWKKSDIWFYPCIFMETFCLTALESASTKTFVITNGLASLENTVKDRGLILPGDPLSEEWQSNAIKQIEPFLSENPTTQTQEFKKQCIDKNSEWSSTLSWENQAIKLQNELEKHIDYEYKEQFYGIRHISTNDFNNIFHIIMEHINNTHTHTQNFKNKKLNLMELNTYTGVGLMKMVRYFLENTTYEIDTIHMADHFHQDLKLKITDSLLKNYKTLHSFIENKNINIKSFMNPENKLSDYLCEMIETTKENDKKHIASYFCLNEYEIVGHLSTLVYLLCKKGILIINITDKNTQLNAVNHFYEQHKKTVSILHQHYKNEKEIIVILIKQSNLQFWKYK